ncbi:MarR family winged helix-turn-helix transcriptional regulator [Frateuria defendens]|uniref:MarR family winged helix-turn-helix transcriptional regulator n=1 Tax=Frateuria defendens TaxID=2219559 RepID=UPI00066FDA86|nr:MarR family winged helix-turn-helix transcriptional regulator [Frateuria defendens]
MDDLRRLRLDLTSSLLQAGRHWQRLANQALQGYGISAACTEPLILIGRSGGGIHQVTLAERLGVAGPSLVRALDKLCAAGLVRREEDASDRRAKTLWLTADGQRLVCRLEERLTLLREDVLGHHTRKELEAALGFYRSFAAAAGQAARAPAQDDGAEA